MKPSSNRIHVIPKGKVSELKQVFEGTIISPLMIEHVDENWYEEINSDFAKLDSITMQNNLNVAMDKPQEEKLLNDIKPNNIRHSQIIYSNMSWENRETKIVHSNTLPRRPIPAPRRLSSNQSGVVDVVKPIKGLPRGTFHDAKQTGHMESFRKKVVAAMDENMIAIQSATLIQQNIIGSSQTLNARIHRDNNSRYENIISDDTDCEEIFENELSPKKDEPNNNSRYEDIISDATDCVNIPAKKHSPKKDERAASSKVEDYFDNSPPRLKPKVINVSKSPKSTTNSEGNTPPNMDCMSSVGVSTEQEASQSRISEVEDVSRKVDRIIEELKSTEHRHVQELVDVVPVFTYAVKYHTSPEIQRKAEETCDTVNKLLDIQKKFHESLEEADGLSVVLETFIDYELLFIIYRQFFTTHNNLGLTITVSDTQTDFQKQITLAGILNQRLVHYRTFLSHIRSRLAGHPDFLQVLLCPLDHITKILDSINVMLVLEPIAGNPLRSTGRGSFDDVSKVPGPLSVKLFDVSGYGDYLLKDKFKVYTPFTQKLTVFLFENIILFTREEQKDAYIYYTHVKTNEIHLLPEEKKKKVLRLKHFDRSKQYRKDIIYELLAPTVAVQKIWMQKIQDVLWGQNLKLKEETLRKYNQISSDL